jgi:FkbM family methyltransferase
MHDILGCVISTLIRYLKVVKNPHRLIKRFLRKIVSIFLNILNKRILNRSKSVQSPNQGQENLIFFSPNSITDFRINTFYEKEPELIEWVEKFGGGTFFDVGANIGLYSIYYAKKFNSSKVYSFECAPKNLKQLTRNVNTNHVQDRTYVISNPLSDDNSLSFVIEGDLIEGSASTAFNSELEYSKSDNPNKFLTLGFSLDWLFENHLLIDIPSLLKIDVDGIEDKILNGSKMILVNKNLNSIYIEVDYMNVMKKNYIHDILQKYEFELLSVNQSPMFTESKYKSLFNEVWIKK